ncbi:MAG: Uma2 family endonuclease [Thermomicrobiales bacterium]
MALAVRTPTAPEDIRPLTYDDLLATPEDGRRYEIIDGEFVVSPSPNTEHQWAAGDLFGEMRTHVRDNDLGVILSAPIDVMLSPHQFVVPDIVFISRERAHIIAKQYIDGAPDLMVEVVSPSSQRRDRVTKAALYAMAGVREYWIVDPGARVVDVFRLRDGRYERIPLESGVARSEVLAGFTIEVARLFALPS